LIAIQHPDDKNAEDITLNRPPKLVKPVLIQLSPSPDFNWAIFKKWEKNAAAIFQIMLRKRW
jgi:hypothetical protein